MPFHDRASQSDCMLKPFRGQAIQVARRPPGWRCLLPFRLQQTTVAKPHEDRVERSRLQSDLQAQLVAIPPNSLVGSQGIEHLHGLRRRAASTTHILSLPM